MHLFFSTPIWTSKIENYETVNNNMLNYITNLQEKNPHGVLRSNFKGWHSKNFDMKDEDPKKFIELIKININTAIKDMGWDLQTQEVKISNMWAIINKKGSLNQKHHHSNSDLSAAYYVKAPENCGDFKVFTPHSISRDKYPERENPTEFNRIVAHQKVEEGDLLIFPSYLPHAVLPNESEEDRVVISFNLYIEQ